MVFVFHTLALQRFIPRNGAMSMEKQATVSAKSVLKNRQRSVRHVVFARNEKTTLTRSWFDATCETRSPPLRPLLRATLCQYSVARFGMMWPDAFTCLLQFPGITNTHPDQLILAEFSAVRTRRLVQNLDMMVLARSVELAKKNECANAEDDIVFFRAASLSQGHQLRGEVESMTWMARSKTFQKKTCCTEVLFVPLG